MASTSHPVTQTPLYIPWNGELAVAIFFVLNGFVMAAAADRRHDAILASSVARYLRLAVPATVSCLLAWLWLMAFPNAIQAMVVAQAEPSRWLEYTRQGPAKAVIHPVADGSVRGS